MRKLLLLLPVLGFAVFFSPHEARAWNVSCWDEPDWYGEDDADYIGCYWGGEELHWCRDTSMIDAGATDIQNAASAWNNWQEEVELVYDGVCTDPDNYLSIGTFNGVNEVTIFDYDPFSEVEYQGYVCSPQWCYDVYDYWSLDGMDRELHEADMAIIYDNMTTTYFWIAFHEFGHMLGLDHFDNAGYGDPCDDDAIMCDDWTQWTYSVPTNDDLDGINFIYDDYDGDGCTGLEEKSAYQAKGGGLSWDNTHRIDSSPLSNGHYDFPDLNASKHVNSVDQGLLASKYGTRTPPHGSTPDYYDQNGDTYITSIDQGILGASFGDSCIGGPN